MRFSRYYSWKNLFQADDQFYYHIKGIAMGSSFVLNVFLDGRREDIKSKR